MFSLWIDRIIISTEYRLKRNIKERDVKLGKKIVHALRGCSISKFWLRLLKKYIYNVFKYNVIEDKWNNKYKYVGYKLIKIHSVEIKKMLTHKI